MSGAVSGSRDMGFVDNNNNKKDGDDGNTSKTASSHQHEGTDDEGAGSLGRQMSEASLSAAEEEEDDDSKLQLGPQYTIKEHLEKDKVFLLSLFFLKYNNNIINFEEFGIDLFSMNLMF